MSCQFNSIELKLSALVDNQLPDDEKEQLLKQLSNSPDLQEKLRALQELKLLTKHAYADIEPAQDASSTQSTRWLRVAGIAATFMLSALILLVNGQDSLGRGADAERMTIVELEQHLNQQSGIHRVVLHLDQPDPRVFAKTIDTAHRLLDDYRSKGIEVEIIANSGGIDLMRADISPYVHEVESLNDGYSNIKFVVCNNAINRAMEKGETIELIKNTRIAPSAVGHVVHRLKEGWTYVKI